ncbi:unnamed protein product [Vitrella brassicaformis CCMP3155]|uniref:Uncharacterized protein n=1 Tax=Vitrella brassicaformis (strain CCMP3155) TaxID=1169540 RepID=A0A0G4EAM1_VITBC|nr:unnamed protein product [Vitrella brassicaformis CCMP3155]|eukprot:CEL92465.1 unnamed protein product [Vitrella brassicaformis CCMP3155]
MATAYMRQLLSPTYHIINIPWRLQKGCVAMIRMTIPLVHLWREMYPLGYPLSAVDYASILVIVEALERRMLQHSQFYIQQN